MAEEGELLGGVRGLPEEGIVKRRSEHWDTRQKDKEQINKSIPARMWLEGRLTWLGNSERGSWGKDEWSEAAELEEEVLGCDDKNAFIMFPPSVLHFFFTLVKFDCEGPLHCSAQASSSCGSWASLAAEHGF